MELEEVLTGIPFYDIFEIDKVGLEYEPELAIYQDSAVPTPCRIVVGDLQYSFDNIWKPNLIFLDQNINRLFDQSVDKSWMLTKTPIYKFQTLFLDSKSFLKILDKHNFFNMVYLPEEIDKVEEFPFDSRINNFEIRTKVLSTVEEAVNNANDLKKLLISILIELKIPRFILLTPGLRFEMGNIDISCTKHLNISGRFKREYSKLFKRKHWDVVIRDWFRLNYPDYFRDEKFLGLLLGYQIKYLNRIHLKLPYKFKDYDKLFQGKAELPNVGLLQEYQNKKGRTTNYEIDYKGCELSLLGMTINSKWRNFNNLV